MQLQNLSTEEIDLCYRADPFEMTRSILKEDLRGLEIISLKGIEKRNLLPKEVVNVLLIYFYQEFGGQVYNRTDLIKLYNSWASNNVNTFDEAVQMAKEDIRHYLGR
ncbi:hypothetical protein [Rossellomorea marisflavi]|uniref:hypothetical protein n=2 Tax=Rossellomorea marisflavi TaxID=189381 RepID=UPI00351545BE